MFGRHAGSTFVWGVGDNIIVRGVFLRTLLFFLLRLLVAPFRSPSRLDEGTDLDGFSDAFRRFERNRKDRTSRIQLGARKNTWMRTAPDMTWLYDYDAWTVPLY